MSSHSPASPFGNCLRSRICGETTARPEGGGPPSAYGVHGHLVRERSCGCPDTAPSVPRGDHEIAGSLDLGSPEPHQAYLALFWCGHYNPRVPPLPPDVALREEATTCLLGLERDPASRKRLFEMLYADLKAQAAALLRKERPDHTLQATALVHEAWLKLIDPDSLQTNDRKHFLALAAQAMRRVLVDHARGRGREKRGGARARVELDEGVAVAEPESQDLVAIDEALTRLYAQSERLGKLVELRFFAGLSREDAAEAMGISEATATRMWRVAKAELTRQLEGGAA